VSINATLAPKPNTPLLIINGPECDGDDRDYRRREWRTLPAEAAHPSAAPT
jgi:hypothetical protein